MFGKKGGNGRPLYSAFSSFTCPDSHYFFNRYDEYLAIAHVTGFGNAANYLHDFLHVLFIHNKLKLCSILYSLVL